ncbi:MAG: DUF726 domain-containing protein [candidate division Zixibacteria bacterium]|nr:DUF726 domain-containing protein [candidate division Zixibacteria bacterium]
MNRMIILIHGYNVSQKKATDSYSAFVTQLKKTNNSTNLLNSIWKFHWPGNHNNRVLSLFSYPLQIDKAKKAATLLSKYLRNNVAGGQEIVFVAHSLGCRLVFETVGELIKAGHLKLAFNAKLCLMGAAVPVYMLLPPDSPFMPVIVNTGRQAVFYSTNDTTLRWFFPSGQTVAREGFFPVAIGLEGGPQGVWKGQSENTWLRHSEYWGNEDIWQSFKLFLGDQKFRKFPERRNDEWELQPPNVINSYCGTISL